MPKDAFPGRALVYVGLFAGLLGACGDPAPAPRRDVTTADDVADAGGSDAAADSQGIDATADSVAQDTQTQDTQSDVTQDAGSDAAVEVAVGCQAGCVDEDDNPCTFSVCEAGSCVSKTAADGSGCEDGNPCSVGDTCKAGTCTASTAPADNVCGCISQADCAAAQDGLACNGSLYCDTSIFPYTCKPNPATIPPCESQSPPSACLVAACLEPAVAGGKPQCSWKKAPNGSACDDGNALTEGDVCFAGSCQSGFFVGGCQNNSDCKAVEDNDLCNGQLFCNVAAGKCQLNPATIVVCPTAGDTTCRKNTCQPATGQCLPQATAEGVVCDDGNSCTNAEVCANGQCGAGASSCVCQQDTDCKPFEDGDLCNGTLYCDQQSGTCAVNPATVVVCGDATVPCLDLACAPTTGTCEEVPAPDGLPCNADNNLCTPEDTCKAGTCSVGNNVCSCATTSDCALFEDGNACNGTLYCNLQNGSCELNAATLVVCDADLNTPCSEQQCQPLSGDCTAVAVAQGQGCDDGNSCTLGDTCAAGSCLGGTVVCACQSDLDCAGSEDGNACNGLLYCDKVSNVCQLDPSSLVVCEDLTPGDCSKTQCMPATGLCEEVTVSAGKACEDGNPCTAAERCDKAGTCSGGLNSCGCKNDGDCAGQDDGNACNGGVFCDFAVFPVPQCAVSTSTTCVANDTGCQTAVCDPATGACDLNNTATGTSCNDGHSCTQSDACKDGTCAGTPLPCNDGNACTTDFCSAGACKYQNIPNNLPCDDGDACTTTDYCVDGTCQHIVLNCPDNDPCLAIGCVAGACVAKPDPLATVCDDGDSCTKPDTCQGGFCIGSPIDCAGDTTGLCSVGYCNNGVCYLAAGNAGQLCEDDNPCTTESRCQNGDCNVVTTLSCSDDDPCTADLPCSPILGCSQPGGPIANTSVYWNSTFDAEGYSLTGLAHGDSSWLAMGTGPTNDPRVYIWSTPGAVPAVHNLTYPAFNAVFAATPSKTDGEWFVVGQHSALQEADAHEEYGAKPLIMRVSASTGLKAAWTNLVPDGSLRTIVPLPTSGHYLVAGLRGAQTNVFDGYGWIAEVDLTGSQPKIVAEGTCKSPFGSMALRPHVLLPLANGGWLVAGNGKTDFGNDKDSATYCRLDANLKQVGDLETWYIGVSYSQGFVRPNGQLYLYMLQNHTMFPQKAVRVLAADGTALSVTDLPSGLQQVVDTKDGWLGAESAAQSGQPIPLRLRPWGGSLDAAQPPAIAAEPDVVPTAMVSDPSGFAWLAPPATVDGGYRLVHVDTRGAQTCEQASQCQTDCPDDSACVAEVCATAGCNPVALVCSDGNGCTLDQCSQGGCLFVPDDGAVCDDGAPCTEQDQCDGGSCSGLDRIGATELLLPASTIGDAVAVGDGLWLATVSTPTDGGVVSVRVLDKYRQVQKTLVVAAGKTKARFARAVDRSGFGAQDSPLLLLGDDVGHWQAQTIAVDAPVQATPVDLGNLGNLPRQPALQWPGGFAVVDDGLLQNNQQIRLTYRLASGPAAGKVRQLVWQPNLALPPLALLPDGQGGLYVFGHANTDQLMVAAYHLILSADKLSYSSTPAISLGFPTAQGGPCNGATQVDGGLMLECDNATGLFVATTETNGIQVGQQLVLSDPDGFNVFEIFGYSPSPRGSVTVGLLNSKSVQLRQHDGFFNGASRGTISVDNVQAIAAGLETTWLVSQVVLAGALEVQVTTLDRWGHATCSDSGSCFANACQDGDFCTLQDCFNDSCGGLMTSGNCGSLGICGTAHSTCP